MEACGSSHHWARELSKFGHDVRLIPANCVKPYVKRGKSDAVDAEAICEAVTRPTMRFVAPGSEAQQAVLSLHLARDLIVRQRTQLSNMLRCLLAEFGIIIAKGAGSAVKFAKGILDGDKPDLPEIALYVPSNLVTNLPPCISVFAGTRCACVCIQNWQARNVITHDPRDWTGDSICPYCHRW